MDDRWIPSPSELGPDPEPPGVRVPITPVAPEAVPVVVVVLEPRPEAVSAGDKAAA